MVWPRALALAECLWSPLNKKNWNGFVKKVEESHARFDFAKVKYATSMYDPIYTVKTNANGKLIVEMQTEVEGLNIHYTFDNSFPDQYYPKYDTPIEVPEEAVMLKVITYRGDAPVGRLNSMPVEELRKRVKK
jgi:hexosaminidase